MKKVTFYLLSEQLNAELQICQQIAAHWRSGKRLLVACQSQQQAEQLDELLWQFDAEQFVPHNLAGEGPVKGAPVELCWPEKKGSSARQLLINLLTDVADFAINYSEIIDFVPIEETGKAAARERYKIYRRAGYQLETLPIPH